MRKEGRMALSVPRLVVRQFRAVLRKLAPPRSPCPFVLIEAGPEGLTLQARGAEAGLRYHLAGDCAREAIQFAGEALARFEGKDDAPVVLEAVAFGKGSARWHDAG